MIFRKKKKFDGEVFAWYIGGYGIGRFIIEGFRTDQLQIGDTGIPISRVVAVCMIIAAITICTVMRIRISKGLMKPYESTYIDSKNKNK
jgi:phosphatidylglycerol:prolipoprotein diacylglycerol transferase